MNATAIDIVILFLVLIGGALGLMAGAIRLVGPFALVLALATLFRSYPQISGLFGGEAGVRFFLYLLLIFIALVIFGFVIRILHGAVRASGLSPLDRLLGVVLGLILGSLLAGGVVWGLETYGTGEAKALLQGAKLAPAALEFFNQVMAFTQRLFPTPESSKEPWWKRPLW